MQFALRDTIGGLTLWALGEREAAVGQLAAMQRLYEDGRVSGGEAVAGLHRA